MTSRRQRGRSDEGATAVFTAVIALLLFAVAALAVEITDMYSRDLASQTTADLAALSGAQGLPGACEAFDRARQTLIEADNSVRDDVDPGPFDSTAAELRDYDPAVPATLENGEIWVLRTWVDGSQPPYPAADVVSTAGCDGASAAASDTTVGEARFVRVLTPTRTVNFAFASALLGGGPGSGSVQASATVGLRTPGSIGDTAPVFLPSGCVSGPQKIITESPGRVPSSTAPDFTPRGATGARNAPVIDSVTSPEVTGGTVQQVTVRVSNLRFDPAGAPVSPATSTVVFDLHNGAGATDTVRYPRPPVVGVAPESFRDVTVLGTGTARRWSASYQVRLPTEVTSVAGDWWVRALETRGTSSTDGWTVAGQAERVSVNALPAPGCTDPSTGNFGFVRADRNDTGTSSAGELGLNFIEGLDVPLEAFPRPLPAGTRCLRDGTPPGARLSTDNPARDGANCLGIESGRNGGNVTDGLVEGEGGKDGRLRTRVPPTGIPAGCTEPGDNTPDYRWRTPNNPAVDVWNTQLSCYLPGGQPLSALETCDSCLDPAILADPRYFIVPVLYETERPSSSSQWPIKEFRGAFITDEVGRGDATCSSARVCNGLEFNNGLQTLFSVQVYVFPLSALPDDLPTRDDGVGYTGSGPKDFLLVE